MYKTCPKCGYERQAQDKAPSEECPSCGLVFSKWIKSLLVDHELEEALEEEAAEETWQKGIKTFFFHPQPDMARGDFLMYVVVFFGFLIWGMDFILMDFRTNAIGQSWLHNVDLIFHEAGHFFFIPFGRYGSILGGSLFQVIVPLFLMLAFLIRNKDSFAAAICLWWAGQSIMDIAPYIADARALRLPLLGGGTGADSLGRHDWENLLRPIGMLEYDIRIATVVDYFGAAVVLLALAWAASMLFIYYRDSND